MILTDQARSKKEINNKSYSSSQTISPSGLRDVAGLTRLLSGAFVFMRMVMMVRMMMIYI